MAVQTKLSNAAAIAACNAVVDLLDGGSGAGYIEIRTGSPPSNVDDAAPGTLLATLPLSDPAFGSAADANPGATATASAITSDSSADATGTAGWFRAYDSNATAVIQGTVGTSDADLILASVSITAGNTVSVSSWTVTMPES